MHQKADAEKEAKLKKKQQEKEEKERKEREKKEKEALEKAAKEKDAKEKAAKEKAAKSAAGAAAEGINGNDDLNDSNKSEKSGKGRVSIDLEYLFRYYICILHVGYNSVVSLFKDNNDKCPAYPRMRNAYEVRFYRSHVIDCGVTMHRSACI